MDRKKVAEQRRPGKLLGVRRVDFLEKSRLAGQRMFSAKKNKKSELREVRKRT